MSLEEGCEKVHESSRDPMAYSTVPLFQLLHAEVRSEISQLTRFISTSDHETMAGYDIEDDGARV